MGGGTGAGGLLLEGPVGVLLGAGAGVLLGESAGGAFVTAGWPPHALDPRAMSPMARSLFSGPPSRLRRDLTAMEGIRSIVAWLSGPDKPASRGAWSG